MVQSSVAHGTPQQQAPAPATAAAAAPDMDLPAMLAAMEERLMNDMRKSVNEVHDRLNNEMETMTSALREQTKVGNKIQAEMREMKQKVREEMREARSSNMLPATAGSM